MTISKETAAHFNELGRELCKDPAYLEKQLVADFNRMFSGIAPPKPIRTFAEADEFVRRDAEGAQTSERG